MTVTITIAMEGVDTQTISDALSMVKIAQLVKENCATLDTPAKKPKSEPESVPAQEPVSAQEPAPVQEPTPAQEPVSAQEPTPAQETVPAAANMTLTEIRKRCTEIFAKLPAARQKFSEILAAAGVESLTKLPEDQYGACMEQLETWVRQQA